MTRTAHDIIYTVSDDPSPIDLRAVFGNDRDVDLEIGSGKGGFLLEQARRHPQRNFFGIEWASKYYRYAVDRMARWDIPNIRLCRTDAKPFVMQRLCDASLSRVHVLHPDPWPKKRHHRRRLFDSAFVEAVGRVLVDHGTLVVQTDHAEYFEQIAAVLDGSATLERTPVTPDNDWEETAIEATNFQVKYAREGRAFYRRVYTRTPR